MLTFPWKVHAGETFWRNRAGLFLQSERSQRKCFQRKLSPQNSLEIPACRTGPYIATYAPLLGNKCLHNSATNVERLSNLWFTHICMTYTHMCFNLSTTSWLATYASPQQPILYTHMYYIHTYVLQPDTHAIYYILACNLCYPTTTYARTYLY
jgi:hypothetical protein